jgi:hypothetical protein
MHGCGPKPVYYTIMLGSSSDFCGLVVRMPASSTQDRGFTPGRSRWIFRVKNPQLAFLQKGSKAVCPMSQICGMLKNHGSRKL